jgi:hypothetical protein
VKQHLNSVFAVFSRHSVPVLFIVIAVSLRMRMLDAMIFSGH